MWSRLLAIVVCLTCQPVAAAQAPVPKPLEQPSAADLASGAKTFAMYCSRCHGLDGSGGKGPPLARPRLRRAVDDTATVDILVNGIPGTSMMAAWSLSEREITQVAAYVRSLGQRPSETLPGDPARGHAIYARVGCATCHIVDGDGSGLGPDLTDVGTRRGSAFLSESLLDPGAARPERAVPYEPYGCAAYVVVRAQPRGGAEVLGVRVNEDAFTVQLRDPQGRLHSFRKAELQYLRPEPATSLMPSVGTLNAHFQFTPHDTHDWDANQIPVLVDATVEGRPRKLVVTAKRNGFYYVLDRTTGEYVRGTAYAKQTWASSLDARGRPQVIPGTEPSETGTVVWPSLQGATNWFSPAFDARRQLLFVPVRGMGSKYFKAKAVYEPGKPFMGGGEAVEAADQAYGAVRALDALTGERRWEHRLLSPLWAGVMATAGGLVFGSTNEGNVYALDAATGRPLWDFQTGGSCMSNPISFLIDGRQPIATACGQAVFVFGLL
jgi:putative heme-binding domain-containing protein